MTTLVPVELWALVEPLLPAPYRGRHRTMPDRACTAAIIDWPPPGAERAGTWTAKG
jgi:hypothetical protein